VVADVLDVRMGDVATVQVLGRLDPQDTAAVMRLVERASDADRVSPLSEHVMLHLRHGGDEPVRNLLARVPDSHGGQQLAGFAHLDVTDVVEGPSAELVVDPACRGRGVGRLLADTLLAQSPNGRLRLWAHGEHPAAAQLAKSLRMTRTRHLLQMRRSLRRSLPRPTVPPEVSVRTFRPGVDDAAWVTLNARSFADHPEQGAWTADDLHRRTSEPWFDPDGFFLAERSTEAGPQLLGFHWTKVHGNQDHQTPDHGHGHDPIGEVYILGVDPEAHGLGLGRALTLVGLQHLRARGLTDVMLYVDADNHAAIHLYESLGFTHWDTDVMYARTATPPAPRPDGVGGATG
jgi:mycothiol synthase